MTKADLVPFVPEATNQTDIDREWVPPTLGSWWWVKDTFYKMRDKYHAVEDADGNPITEPTLACVHRLGSNYAKVETPQGSSVRIHFDRFEELCEAEPNPEQFLKRKIEYHKDRVVELMFEIRRVTALLGIVPRDQLANASEVASQALATVSTTEDVNAHKKALILAKEKTLPDLFKLVEQEHEQMAIWMKGELLPAQAQIELLEGATEQIEDRIFTVELYAGLVEEIEMIRDGKPAANDTPIHLFQRRHYMDEECLINYQAGGMHFGHISAFDRWLVRPENASRLLPMPRCIVAFRVRRFDRHYDWDETGASISGFISFNLEREDDKLTFLYIRNGEQIFRMATKIDFGSELFPDVDQDVLFNDGAAWIENPGGHDGNRPRSQQQYDAAWQSYRDRRSALACLARAWRRAGKPEGSWQFDDQYLVELEAFDPYHVNRVRTGLYGRDNHGDPLDWHSRRPDKPKFVPFTPDSVYYDDATAKITAATKEHNRVAVVLQGLLDRSPVFQPHPPWRLWTPEGFGLAIKLVYDQTRSIANGTPPDFEGYRTQLNSTIREGSITVGQEHAWMQAEAVKYNQSIRRSYRNRGEREKKWHKPYGNPGPGLFAKVRSNNRGKLTYRWIRDKKSENSWRSGEYPTAFRCAPAVVLNVSAYTRGDFKMFFDDPRTRADYYKWAPYLLAAEDFAAGKVKRIGHVVTGRDAAFELDHEDTKAAAKADREAERLAELREAEEEEEDEDEDDDDNTPPDDGDDDDDDDNNNEDDDDDQ